MSPVQTVSARQNQYVDVDWSTVTLGSSTTVFDELVGWMKTCPQTQRVHVTLPSVHNQPTVRRLQRTLQSMGCKVTTKTGTLCS